MKKLKVALLATAAVFVSAGAAQADITIAVAGPMTGQYAVFGEQIRNGGEMAVKDINAAGGVLGQKLKLEVGDDACDPKQAVAVANQLANRGVVFVAGHWCSSSSIPASDVYADEGIVQISPGSTNPQLTERGPGNRLPRLRPVTTSRVRSRRSSLPSISRARMLPSFMTRPPTARAWLTRPRSR